MPFSDYKVATVTGASAGMGEAIVERLCQEGIEVHAVARRHEQLAATADRTGCIPHAVDVGDSSALTALCRGLQVDILVNNAGVSHPGSILDAEADWVNTRWMSTCVPCCTCVVCWYREWWRATAVTSLILPPSLRFITSMAIPSITPPKQECTRCRVSCASIAMASGYELPKFAPGGWRRRYSVTYPAITKTPAVALSMVSSCRKQKISPTAWPLRSPRRWQSTSAILRSRRRCRYPVGYPRCVTVTVSPE